MMKQSFNDFMESAPISVVDEPQKFGKDVNDELLCRLERPIQSSRQTRGMSR
jgi:restriction endonuclease